MIERVAILGTGLLGTSVGLALRGAGFGGSIVGWNRSAEGAQEALSMHAIDSIAPDAVEAARASQVVVLSVPIYSTLDHMEQLAAVLGPEHLVTDVGSTKAQITEAAGRLFNAPDRAAFLPGHPMAGKERGGAALGDGNLFRGAVWLFTDDPSWRRSARGVELVQSWRDWVVAMGSKTIDLDAGRHDELLAWVSHLPQFLSTALSALLEEEFASKEEVLPIGGRALREMTRLGASPYSMWRDIALTNKTNIRAALLRLEQHLAHIRENLDTRELAMEFERAHQLRKTAPAKQKQLG